VAAVTDAPKYASHGENLFKGDSRPEGTLSGSGDRGNR
jgi:hypothetical protein